MNQVKWADKAFKQLLKLDKRYRLAIIEKVDQLASFPDVVLDIKKLAGRDSHYRLRVGGYRVVFEWHKEQEPQIVEIQQVETRQSVYKN